MKFLLLITLFVSLVFGAVDINTADKKELMSLNGVGAKKAEAIIEYRNGECFKNVNDIVNIKGIGKKFLENHRDELNVSECKS